MTISQALPKIKQFCAYQERCHQEVKDKLYSFEMNRADVDQVISALIEENYLNEERFAIQFAGGKFRMKGWGKVKIKYELKQKRVSDFCIRKALASLDEEKYDENLNAKALAKWQTLSSEKNIFTKRRKLMNYLLQKGFEANLCQLAMADLEKLNKK